MEVGVTAAAACAPVGVVDGTAVTKRKRVHRGSRRAKKKPSDKPQQPKAKKQKKAAKDPEKSSTPQSSKAEEKPAKSQKSELIEKLNSGRFRFINEQMYSTDGWKTETMFKEDNQAFAVYHHGYATQVSKWPQNPLDTIIMQLKKLPKTWVVADMGCGEGRLAASVHQTTHSFDLVSVNDRVVACNMAKVPLQPSTVNVVVFCLSLMGTNLHEYLREANRILQEGGTLKVAEIISRITSMRSFLRALEKLGFALTRKKLLGDMFVMMDFEKTSAPLNKRPPGLMLQPCLYKKR